jgi:hypothetical protein
MATKTLGTNATNTLTALAFLKGIGSIPAADVASLANSIKDDLGNAHAIWPGAFSAQGQLYIPNRGFLKVYEGDWVGVDSRGWPILLSKDTIANGPWTHS